MDQRMVEEEKSQVVVEKAAGVLSPGIQTLQPSALPFSRRQTVSRVCLPPMTPLVTDGGTASSGLKSSDVHVLGETSPRFPPLGSQIPDSQRMPGLLLPGVGLDPPLSRVPGLCCHRRYPVRYEAGPRIPREANSFGGLAARAEVTPQFPEERPVGGSRPPGSRPVSSSPERNPRLLPRGPAHAHRLLQVAARLLAVLGVVVEHRAELQMCSGLNALRRLEGEHGLQAVHAQADLGRAGSAEVLGKAQER